MVIGSAMSLLVLGSLLSSYNFAEIPTEAEQANLLTNVQEVFEQVKLLVKDETSSTSEAVAGDVDSMIDIAQHAIATMEELIITKLSATSNRVCPSDPLPKIQQFGSAALDELASCRAEAVRAVEASCGRLTNTTGAALGRGQQLLDTLAACSRKRGLAVVSCYARVIRVDVAPVKRVLVDAVGAHRAAHFAEIEVRGRAHGCVGRAVGMHGIELQQALADAVECACS